MNALVLGGPAHAVMTGWEHVQIIIRHAGGLKVSTCISQTGRGEVIARELRGKFFPRGTWEGSEYGMENKSLRSLLYKSAVLLESKFPAPRPEILDELFRTEKGLIQSEKGGAS